MEEQTNNFKTCQCISISSFKKCSLYDLKLSPKSLIFISPSSGLRSLQPAGIIENDSHQLVLSDQVCTVLDTYDRLVLLSSRDACAVTLQ